jgi:hypothetical protein
VLLHSWPTRVENFALANNGFIWGGSPEVDFTLPGDVAWEYAALSRKGVEPEYVCRTPVMYDESVLAAASHFESKVGITAFSSSNPQASLVRRSRANSTEYVAGHGAYLWDGHRCWAWPCAYYCLCCPQSLASSSKAAARSVVMAIVGRVGHEFDVLGPFLRAVCVCVFGWGAA